MVVYHDRHVFLVGCNATLPILYVKVDNYEALVRRFDEVYFTRKQESVYNALLHFGDQAPSRVSNCSRLNFSARLSAFISTFLHSSFQTKQSNGLTIDST